MCNTRVDLDPVYQAHRIVPPRQTGDKRLEPLQADLVQALQLDDGFGVVVHPQVEQGVVFVPMDAQGRSLLAAFVPTRCLSRNHGGQQPLGQRAPLAATNASAVASITRGPASILPATLKSS